MRAGTKLAGQRRDRLLGIIDDAQRADVAVDLVREEGLRQVQRQREDAHEVRGQLFGRPVIGGHGRPERGRRLRPHVVDEVRLRFRRAVTP